MNTQARCIPGNSPISAGRDCHPAKAAQQRGAAAARLLTAEGRQVRADLGQAGGLGPVQHPDPLVVAALAPSTSAAAALSVGRSSTNFGRDESTVGQRLPDGRGRRARRCAGGMPGPPSWDPRARGAAIDDGSGRWIRHLDAHRIAAKRSGPTPPPREELRGPAGSQSSLPDDLPSLSGKTLVNGPLQMVDGGEMPQRRPRRHFSASLRLYPLAAPNQGILDVPVHAAAASVRWRDSTTARRCTPP